MNWFTKTTDFFKGLIGFANAAAPLAAGVAKIAGADKDTINDIKKAGAAADLVATELEKEDESNKV